jgi:large subunit ribosomal protein L29
MTSKEIRDLAPAEIQNKIRESREKLLQLRLRKQTGQVEKTHELRALRKDVARFETALSAKKATTAA